MVEENLSHGMCMLSLSGPLSQSVGGRASHGPVNDASLTALPVLAVDRPAGTGWNGVRLDYPRFHGQVN